MNGLKIKEPYLGYILNGKKDVEIRKCGTWSKQIRNQPIWLCGIANDNKKDQIVGIAIIKEVRDEFLFHFSFFFFCLSENIFYSNDYR